MKLPPVSQPCECVRVCVRECVRVVCILVWSKPVTWGFCTGKEHTALLYKR